MSAPVSVQPSLIIRIPGLNSQPGGFAEWMNSRENTGYDSALCVCVCVHSKPSWPSAGIPPVIRERPTGAAHPSPGVRDPLCPTGESKHLKNPSNTSKIPLGSSNTSQQPQENHIFFMFSPLIGNLEKNICNNWGFFPPLRAASNLCKLSG